MGRVAAITVTVAMAWSFAAPVEATGPRQSRYSQLRKLGKQKAKNYGKTAQALMAKATHEGQQGRPMSAAALTCAAWGSGIKSKAHTIDGLKAEVVGNPGMGDARRSKVTKDVKQLNDEIKILKDTGKQLFLGMMLAHAMGMKLEALPETPPKADLALVPRKEQRPGPKTPSNANLVPVPTKRQPSEPKTPSNADLVPVPTKRQTHPNGANAAVVAREVRLQHTPTDDQVAAKKMAQIIAFPTSGGPITTGAGSSRAMVQSSRAVVPRGALVARNSNQQQIGFDGWPGSKTGRGVGRKSSPGQGATFARALADYKAKLNSMATDAERTAFVRKEAMRHHPDRTKHLSELEQKASAEKMKALVQARKAVKEQSPLGNGTNG